MIDTTRVGIKAPPPPSKWDIIPIHTSDRATFKFCRRQWIWSSPTRFNLVPKTSIHGVRMPLWFGTGIHHALERYYHPYLREDPVEVFQAWFHLQWNGGLIHRSELKEFADRNPTPHPSIEDTFVVRGLSDILPDPDYEVFEEHLDLGIGMLKFYKEYAEEHDNFSVIEVEHDFSVPLLDPNGAPVYMVDNRPMPENWCPASGGNEYGPFVLAETTITDPATDKRVTVYKKQLHARGRMDVIVQDLESGRFGIRDYKTAARIDDDYFRHLDLDEQCTTYLWAGEQEAKLYGLEYSQLDYVDYIALRKNYPKPPTMLNSGLPSIDRQKESTTAAMFEKAIKDNGLQMVFDDSEKLQNYYTYLVQMGDKLFIQFDPVRRNRHQKANCGVRLYYEAVDMLSNPVPYPNPNKNIGCLNCVFRPPCVAAESGSDFQAMLDDGYESNYDR
jgi:hypothetical protein